MYGFPVLSPRLDNMYGAALSDAAGFYSILNWFMANRMRQTRDRLPRNSDRASGEMFFVGSGVETVFPDMVKEIIRGMGKGELTKRFIAAYEKTAQALDWHVQVSFFSGIGATAAYCAKQLASHRRGPG